MTNRQVSTGNQYPYPAVPRKWDAEERQFSQGLRGLFNILFSRKQTEYCPVGMIVIMDAAPTTFGTWEEVDIGITGTKAWKRLK